MATKAYEKFKACLTAKPLYFWDNGKITAETIKCHTRCADHIIKGEEGKKLTSRMCWNDNFNCDICGYPRI